VVQKRGGRRRREIPGNLTHEKKESKKGCGWPPLRKKDNISGYETHPLKMQKRGKTSFPPKVSGGVLPLPQKERENLAEKEKRHFS